MTNTARKLRIALLGTRGIPANYGGFETFVDELSRILAERGHEVTVYGRRFFGNDDTQQPPVSLCGSVRSIRTLTIAHKYLETPCHAITSNIDLWLRRDEFDCALLCNAANSPFAWMIRLAGIPLAINVDGIERKRAKWNAVGRLWYRLGEYASTLFAHRVVGDAQVICDYYQERFSCDATMIPYGARAVTREAGPTLAQFNLSSGTYILYVSRLEPENNALGVIEAYKQSGIKQMPLVIVGDAPYADNYKAALREAAVGCDVRFTGFQFGAAYQELRSHCQFYIQATEVGGTHPALIEALAYGNPTIINGTPENIEVAGACTLSYAVNDFRELAQQMKLLAERSDLRENLAARSKEHVAHHYSWDAVADQYEKLFLELLAN
jgi:glycosyltransferase involved in cell wall biosynthesis